MVLPFAPESKGKYAAEGSGMGINNKYQPQPTSKFICHPHLHIYDAVLPPILWA
jgi:hypothetical protein